MPFPILPDSLGTEELDGSSLAAALLRKELDTLQSEATRLEVYQNYYDGDQPLAFSTALFADIFGAAFEGFRDNWMQVIVNAVETKLNLSGIGGENRELADRIWEIFKANEIAEESSQLHEGLLIQERSYAIVWPDETIGATVDWQPANLVSVRYDPEKRRTPMWAVKRWVDDEGRILVNVYTDKALYKYIERGTSVSSVRQSTPSARSEIPNAGVAGMFTPRRVQGELWPLPHPFNRVPVVQFDNKSYQSEISGAIPQQDALNKTLLDMLISGEFQAFPQRYVESMSGAPIGGWKAGAGEVWEFKPGFDSEGKPIRGQFGSFPTSDPSNYIEVVNVWLDHMAYTSFTPSRLFRSVDKGGRGDAPSGQSILIGDKPLNEKVERKQQLLNYRWMDVAKLVAIADKRSVDDFRTAEVLWKDPRYDHRLAILEEAAAMVTIGLPFKYVIRQLGLTPKEIEEIERMKDEELDEEHAEAEKKFAREQQTAELQGFSLSRGIGNRLGGADGRRTSPAGDPEN